MTARGAHKGMTVLELMVVLAIIGGAAFLMRTGFRAFTKADLVEDSTALSAVLKRASQLAVEHGELHRVVLDFDKGVYSVEICEGELAIHRDESVTKGQVAIYFFPLGSSEKSVIEMTDGDETFSVLVYGLSGRVELRDGVLRDVNAHMMKNIMGDRDLKRDDVSQ